MLRAEKSFSALHLKVGQDLCMPDTITREQYGDAYEKGGLRRTVVVLTLLGVSVDQADDVAQEAWGARAWTKRHQLKESERVVEWVTSIAINLFRDQASKDRRLTPLQSAGFEPRIEPTVRPDIIDLHRALEDCPARQRALLKAVYLDGRSVAELAASLAVSVGAVHHRLSRARRRLSRAMNAA